MPSSANRAHGVGEAVVRDRLDNNAGAPCFHGACNPLIDVNIGTDAAKRDTGAKAAD
jgi:hypothetical protein